MKKIQILVACRDFNGSADAFVCEVEATDAMIKNGDHYDIAIEMAEEADYHPPFLCYDHTEQRNLLNEISELNQPAIPFKLNDHSPEGGEPISGSVVLGHDGVEIKLKGFSDATSKDNKGTVAFLEQHDNQVLLRAYSDVNREDPTDAISLEGARNTARVD
ncbi:hypothetical protein [Vibrio alginolyticus]|uniref:hypothetical protein n=1 Tax=Vibrio alginolyticus TaxID=663 RepID=UPI0006CA66F5|nr:hypothetical protein [Vibrio alginolyticus]